MRTARSITVAAGATGYLILGPFPEGAGLDILHVVMNPYGALTSTASLRVALCDQPPSSTGMMDEGDPLTYPLTLTPGQYSNCEYPLPIRRNVAKRRYVAIEVTAPAMVNDIQVYASADVRFPRALRAT